MNTDLVEWKCTRCKKTEMVNKWQAKTKLYCHECKKIVTKEHNLKSARKRREEGRPNRTPYKRKDPVYYDYPNIRRNK